VIRLVHLWGTVVNVDHLQAISAPEADDESVRVTAHFADGELEISRPLTAEEMASDDDGEAIEAAALGEVLAAFAVEGAL
jgi:hypothetical protein